MKKSKALFNIKIRILSASGERMESNSLREHRFQSYWWHSVSWSSGEFIIVPTFKRCMCLHLLCKLQVWKVYKPLAVMVKECKFLSDYYCFLPSFLNHSWVFNSTLRITYMLYAYMYMYTPNFMKIFIVIKTITKFTNLPISKCTLQ